MNQFYFYYKSFSGSVLLLNSKTVQFVHIESANLNKRLYLEGDVCPSHLSIDFLCSHSCVPQLGSAAVRGTDAAARREAAERKVGAAEPAGVVMNSTAV